MRLYLLGLGLFGSLVTSIGTVWAGTSQATQSVQQAPYLFCNVFLADACFGIAAGDRMTMSVVMDFVLYEIQFADGKKVKLYSGYNPELLGADSNTLDSCTWKSGFEKCKMGTLEDGRVEFLAQRAPTSTAIHLVIDANANLELVHSFLRNIKPCTRIVNSIECARN